MSSKVQTRSSLRRSTRKVKPQCSDDCCKSVEHKKKASIKKSKTKKAAANDKKSVVLNNKDLKSKISHKNSLLEETTRENSKPTATRSSKSLSKQNSGKDHSKRIKNCVVSIEELPEEVIKDKLKNIVKECAILDCEEDTNQKRIVRNKQAISKKHVSKENINRTSAVRLQRNVKKSLLDNKKSENEKTHISSKPDESKNSTSKCIPDKLPKENNPTKSHNGVIKRSVPATNLRKRKTMNYAETTLESSVEAVSKKDALNKLPVYKQPIPNTTNKKKRNGDLYEFDESDENDRKKKKRKNADSSVDEYERTVKNILKNVVNKVRKRKQKEIYVDNNNLKTKAIKTVLSTQTDKNENKKIGTKNSPIKPVTTMIPLQEENKEEHTRPSESLKVTEENNINNSVLPVEKNTSKINYDNANECFGFNIGEINTNKNQSSQVNIISNVVLQPEKELNLSVASPTTFRDNRPKANSTMLNNVFSPWRFNEMNVTRNPHFLAIKESSLPCMSQEMVLDHSIVDKFEGLSRTRLEKTPQRKTDYSHVHKKTPVQKYVTDYFGNKGENKENIENTHVSLFDSDQFSPIKNRRVLGDSIEITKRRILGEKNDNVITPVHASTPKQSTPTVFPVSGSSKESDDIHTNFGFSSDDDEENDQTPVKKSKDAKPFRMSVNQYDKKYTRPKKRKIRPEVIEEPSDDESDKSDASDEESQNGEVKLFDDFDVTDDLLKETKLTKKKTKLRWLNDDNQKCKKKKDIRTKEEEEEAEKWAAAFNSMCEEIEEYPLEIE